MDVFGLPACCVKLLYLQGYVHHTGNGRQCSGSLCPLPCQRLIAMKTGSWKQFYFIFLELPLHELLYYHYIDDLKLQQKFLK